jgi:signal transduction histidine kinase
LAIRDDGIGGANPVRGSGLTGLSDRVEAVGGTLDVSNGSDAGVSSIRTDRTPGWLPAEDPAGR